MVVSKLKIIRESQNLTQEELSKKSQISVRTIQRIEAGTEPKGYTLKSLAKALSVQANELLINKADAEPQPACHDNPESEVEPSAINYRYIKMINLSSLLFVVLPPLNILIPLLLSYKLKTKNRFAKQIVSIQIMWTILAPIVFMLGILLKLGNTFTLGLMVFIVLSNVFIILRNAMEIDRNKKLYFKLNFNMI